MCGARQAAGVARVEASGRKRALVAVAVAVCTVVGGLLRFWRLGGQSFWLDEVYTWDILHRSLASMLKDAIPGSESTPPLYYALAWFWVRLFGWSEAALRSLSALLGTATIPIAYLVGRAFAGRRAGLLTALVVAVSPILVWYSQEARSYALFVFLSAASLLFFARLWRRYSHADLLGWSATTALSLTTHYFALFLLVAETVFLWRRLPRRRLLLGLAAPALTCLLLAPLVWLQRSNAAGLATATSLRARVLQTAEWFGASDLRSDGVWIIVATLVFCAFILLVTGDTPNREGGLLALEVAVTAAVLPMMLALAGKDYVFSRNLIALWLPLAVAVAAGLTSRRVLPLGLAAAAVLVAALVYADFAVRTRPELQRDDYRLLARNLGSTSHTLFVVYPGWDTRPLQHYRKDLHRIASPQQLRTRQIVLIGIASNFRAWVSPEQLRLTRPPGFHLIAAKRLQHFVVRLYLARRPRAISTPELQLAPTPIQGHIPFLSFMR